MWKRVAYDSNSQMSSFPKSNNDYSYSRRSLTQPRHDLNFASRNSTASTSNIMNDDINWVTAQPSLPSDGEAFHATEKFQIKLNTEGFHTKDIDVYTRNRKLHINAFRQELNASGSKITNRLERSYDIPYDADVSAMSVKFPTECDMVVEFPVVKSVSSGDPSRYTSTSVYGGKPVSSYSTLSSKVSNGMRSSNICETVQSLPRVSQQNSYVESNVFPIDDTYKGNGQMHKATLVNVRANELNKQKEPESSEFTQFKDAHILDSTKNTKFSDKLNFPTNSLDNSHSRTYDMPVYPKIVRDEQTGKNRMSLSLEVHGFEPSDFHVSVNNNNQLLIEANHINGTGNTSQRKYYRKEITLPPETDVNHLRTQLIDGYMLEVDAPMLESQWISVPIERKV